MPKMRVGFWKSSAACDMPTPTANPEAWAGQAEFVANLLALESRTEAVSFRGISYCRLCCRSNGNREFRHALAEWPEGLRHYIAEHNVRPPDEFIEFVNGADHGAASDRR